MARPTDYNKNILAKVANYLDHYAELAEEQSYEAVIPTVQGLCLHIGIGTTTAYNWAEKHEEFRVMLDSLKDIAHEKLVQLGLGGKTNSTITKLMLTKHGYSDKQELTGKDGEAVFPTIKIVHE